MALNGQDILLDLCQLHFAPTTEQRVSLLEGRIGVTFPAFFRSFLLSFNGGKFRHGIEFPVINTKLKYTIEALYGIDVQSSCFDIGGETLLNAQTPTHPNDPIAWLPIGSTPGNFIICLNVQPTSQDYGMVVLKTPADEWLYLAETFDAFLDGLYLAEWANEFD